MRRKADSSRNRVKYSLRRFNPQAAMFQLYKLKNLLDDRDQTSITQNKE